MTSRLKQVALAVKLSAKISSSAWRSNKPWSELTAGLRDERSNHPQIILPNEDEEDSFVGTDESAVVVDESSMVVDETGISPWSEVTAKLTAERINRPQIIFSKEEEEEDSFVGMDESSMALDETDISSWSEVTAKLRAERINRPQMKFSDEDEDEDNFMSMDESSMALDETHIISSSSSSFSEKSSKFGRPSSLRWTKENANSVSLIGSICNRVMSKRTDSGQHLVWTSIAMRDENLCASGRVGLYFLDELAGIANQHLKINDHVHVSGELVQRKCKIWVIAKALKFIQRPVTPNTVET